MSANAAPARASKQRVGISATSCFLLTVGTVMFHIMIWSTFKGNGRLEQLGSVLNSDRGTQSTEADPPLPARDEHPLPVSASDLEADQTDRSEETSVLPDSREEEEQGENDTDCAKGEVSIDSAGNPCLDLAEHVSKQAVYRSMNPQYPYVYCAIPKNGCTYHLALLNRVNGESTYEDSRTIHSKELKAKISLSAMSNDDIAKLFTNTSIPKYLVVRNPMTRILSAYLDKVYPYLPEENRTAEYFHHWIYQEFPADQPVDRQWQGVNPHWTPQLEFCGFRDRDFWKYFKFFRVEEPEEYVDFLYQILPPYVEDGWAATTKSSLSFREHVLGPRKRTGNTNERFVKFFSSLEVFDHLAAKLQMDIDRLGYREGVRQLREEVAASLKK